MARQSKLTPETQQKIVDAIAKGNYLETAAALGGITYKSLNNWMNKGAANKGDEYVQFFHAVKRAEAEAEAARVERINSAGKDGNWQADAWYLERRYPDRWGKRVQEVTGKDGGPIRFEELRNMTDDQLRAIVEA